MSNHQFYVAFVRSRRIGQFKCFKWSKLDRWLQMKMWRNSQL